MLAFSDGEWPEIEADVEGAVYDMELMRRAQECPDHLFPKQGRGAGCVWLDAGPGD